MSGEPDRDGESAPRSGPDGWADVDIDAVFTEIISTYGQSGPQVGPWPVAEEVDLPDAPASRTSPPASSGTSPPGRAPGTGPAPGTGTGTQPPSDGSGRITGDAGQGASADPSPSGERPAPTDPGPGSGDRGSGDPRSGPGSGDPRSGPGSGDPRSGPGSGDPRSDPGSGDPGPAGAPDLVPGEAGTRPEDEDRFIPPEPPPLPRGDFITTFAWVCVLGGPLLLIAAAVAWRDIPGWLILTAVAAFIGGFVTLVARLPEDHGDDDDGAVV